MPYCRWGPHEPSFDIPLMREGEADHVASGGDRHILRPVDRITHRGSVDVLAGVELPEGTAGSRCNRFKSSGIVREEHQIARRGERPAPGVSPADLRIAPDDLAFGHGVRQQNLLRGVIGHLLRARTVVRLALGKRLRMREEDAATLKRHHIEESGVGIVRRRKPIRGAIDARTNVGTRRRRYSSRQYGAAGGVNSFRPVQLRNERRCLQELSVGPVENIKKPVTIGLHQQITGLAVQLQQSTEPAFHWRRSRTGREG